MYVEKIANRFGPPEPGNNKFACLAGSLAIDFRLWWDAKQTTQQNVDEHMRFFY